MLLAAKGFYVHDSQYRAMGIYELYRNHILKFKDKFEK